MGDYLIVVNISVHSVDILLVFVTFYNFLFVCLLATKRKRKKKLIINNEARSETNELMLNFQIFYSCVQFSGRTTFITLCSYEKHIFMEINTQRKDNNYCHNKTQ